MGQSDLKWGVMYLHDHRDEEGMLEAGDGEEVRRVAPEHRTAGKGLCDDPQDTGDGATQVTPSEDLGPVASTLLVVKGCFRLESLLDDLVFVILGDRQSQCEVVTSDASDLQCRTHRCLHRAF